MAGRAFSIKTIHICHGRPDLLAFEQSVFLEPTFFFHNSICSDFFLDKTFKSFTLL